MVAPSRLRPLTNTEPMGTWHLFNMFQGPREGTVGTVWGQALGL